MAIVVKPLLLVLVLVLVLAGCAAGAPVAPPDAPGGGRLPSFRTTTTTGGMRQARQTLQNGCARLTPRAGGASGCR
jgi:hypothetical protein